MNNLFLPSQKAERQMTGQNKVIYKYKIELPKKTCSESNYTDPSHTAATISDEDLVNMFNQGKNLRKRSRVDYCTELIQSGPDLVGKVRVANATYTKHISQFQSSPKKSSKSHASYQKFKKNRDLIKKLQSKSETGHRRNTEGILYSKPEMNTKGKLHSKPQTGQKRRQRCNACVACTRDECGKCTFCLDMKKNGGSGKLKQGCKLKKCVAMSVKYSTPVGKKHTQAVMPPRKLQKLSDIQEAEVDKKLRENMLYLKQQQQLLAECNHPDHLMQVEKSRDFMIGYSFESGPPMKVLLLDIVDITSLDVNSQDKNIIVQKNKSIWSTHLPKDRHRCIQFKLRRCQTLTHGTYHSKLEQSRCSIPSVEVNPTKYLPASSLDHSYATSPTNENTYTSVMYQCSECSAKFVQKCCWTCHLVATCKSCNIMFTSVRSTVQLDKLPKKFLDRIKNKATIEIFEEGREIKQSHDTTKNEVSSKYNLAVSLRLPFINQGHQRELITVNTTRYEKQESCGYKTLGECRLVSPAVFTNSSSPSRSNKIKPIKNHSENVKIETDVVKYQKPVYNSLYSSSLRVNVNRVKNIGHNAITVQPGSLAQSGVQLRNLGRYKNVNDSHSENIGHSIITVEPDSSVDSGIESINSNTYDNIANGTHAKNIGQNVITVLQGGSAHSGVQLRNVKRNVHSVDTNVVRLAHNVITVAPESSADTNVVSVNLNECLVETVGNVNNNNNREISDVNESEEFDTDSTVDEQTTNADKAANNENVMECDSDLQSFTIVNEPLITIS